jgi:predicted transcriptional regulator
VAQNANLQKMFNATDETFDVQNMINKALMGILISKEIITEEEMLIILGNINKQQDIYFEQQD